MSAEASSTVTDRLGVEIQTGDRVCYPVRQGSYMWMRDGIVVAVSPDSGASPEYQSDAYIKVRDDKNHTHVILALGRVTVLCNEGAVGLLPPEPESAAQPEEPLALWDRILGWVRQ